ncbi:MAG: SPOR domain-containing protein [Acidobacteriota bacterium]
MQFEMAHPSCPLCKRPLSAGPVGLAPDTRLCDQCQTIVQTAFSGTHSRIAPQGRPVQNNGASALVQQGASALDCPQIDSSVFVEDRLGVVESFDQEAESAGTFELYDESNPEPDSRENEDVDDGTRTLTADLPDLPENGSLEPRTAASIGGFEAKPADAEYTRVDDSLPHDEPRTFVEHAASSPAAQVSLFDDQSNEPHTSEETSVDPWENPLPAWDYSHNEWPVLMRPGHRTSFRKLRASLAVLMVLAFAAGFYFLMRPTSSAEQRTAAPVDSAVLTGEPAAAEPQPSAANSEESVAQPGASLSSSDAPASADLKPAQTAAAEQAGSGDNGNSQGRFSLQAAAFPTQAAAEEFAEKLRHAGVPSYVVGTDLARRGRWFRVRIGRFNAADEAQRFAAEAQLRAKAAGMSLQLIACQYEQP